VVVLTFHPNPTAIWFCFITLQARRSLFNAAKYNDVESARFWLADPPRHRVNAKDA
jgi:hypothetical protein